jgi:hypothetical protein
MKVILVSKLAHLSTMVVASPFFSRDMIPLKDWVSSRAYYSTLLSQVFTELTDSFPLTHTHFESFLFFFFVWTFLRVANTQNEEVFGRLSDVIEYKEIKRNTSAILLVVYIIFCKNVDYAL